MGLTSSDINPTLIQCAKSVVLSGTHFSTETTARASRKTAELCREAGGRVAFDMDYYPILWVVGDRGTGEHQYKKSGDVTAHLKAILPLCDLVVGTEEELHIAGGATDTLAAIRVVRSLTNAAIVCRRGTRGCIIFPDTIPNDMEKGISVSGFAIDVFNVVGAADAFISGFLRGWRTNQS